MMFPLISATFVAAWTSFQAPSVSGSETLSPAHVQAPLACIDAVPLQQDLFSSFSGVRLHLSPDDDSAEGVAVREGVRAFLTQNGISVDGNSNIHLMVRISPWAGKFSSQKQDGTERRESVVSSPHVLAELFTYGGVVRSGSVDSVCLVLASAALSRPYLGLEIQQELRHSVHEVLSALSRPQSRFGGGVVRQEIWRRFFLDVDSKRLAEGYKASKALGGISDLRGLTALSDVRVQFGARNEIPALQISESLGMKSLWDSESRWVSGLKGCGLPVDSGWPKGGLPLPFVQYDEFGYQVFTHRNGNSNQAAYSLVCEANLVEPFCFFYHSGKWWRTPAATLSSEAFRMAVGGELAPALSDCAGEAIQHFTKLLAAQRLSNNGAGKPFPLLRPKGVTLSRPITLHAGQATSEEFADVSCTLRDLARFYARQNRSRSYSEHKPMLFRNKSGIAFLAGIEVDSGVFQVVELPLNAAAKERRAFAQFEQLGALNGVNHQATFITMLAYKHSGFNFLLTNYPAELQGILSMDSATIPSLSTLLE